MHIIVLKIVISIREHKSLLMDNVNKDGSKDYNIEILQLKIGEIVTLKLDDDKDYQITNENIILNNNSNYLIMELLNKTFLEFMKTDFLLSNEQFNEKYKLKENNKFLLENHFKSENDKKRIKDLINNLNERLNKLRKGNLRNKKMELIPSEKITKLLEDYSVKKNSNDSILNNLEPENSEIIQDFPINNSQGNLLQNASKQSNSCPNETNDYENGNNELIQSKILEHDYNYNEIKMDISREDVEPENSEIIQDLLDDYSQDNLLKNVSTQSNSYPNVINDYENGNNELMQSTILVHDYNEEDFKKAYNNVFTSDYEKKKNFEIKYNEKK